MEEVVTASEMEEVVTAAEGFTDRGDTEDPNRYISYPDSDSGLQAGLQALEDDWHWHHDRRKAEGHDTCPDCGHDLTSWWPNHRSSHRRRRFFRRRRIHRG